MTKGVVKTGVVHHPDPRLARCRGVKMFITETTSVRGWWLDCSSVKVEVRQAMRNPISFIRVRQQTITYPLERTFEFIRLWRWQNYGLILDISAGSGKGSFAE